MKNLELATIHLGDCLNTHCRAKRSGLIYGHGERGLSMVFYLLNLLAFLAHQVLEMGDRL